MVRMTFQNDIIDYCGDLFRVINTEPIIELDHEALGFTDIPGIMTELVDEGDKGVRFSLVNKTHKAVKLGKLYFIHEAKIRIEDAIVIIQKNKSRRNMNLRINDFGDSMASEIFTVFHKEGTGGLSLGFNTFDRAFCRVEFKRDNSKGGALILENNSDSRDTGIRLSAYCDFNGFELGPGEAILSERFFVEEKEDTYGLLEAFAESVAREYDLTPFVKRPTGWIGGWNFRDGFYRENMEKLIKENVRAISKRLKGFGIEYIWISTVNMKDNLPGNWNLDNEYNFPEGLASISEFCKENEMKAGLWIAPFWMNEASDNLGFVEEAIAVKNGIKAVTDKGRVTHQPFNGKREEDLPRVYYLDPSHPDLHEFLRRIFSYYNEIGIAYYMVDFLVHGIDPEYDIHDKSVINGPESYRTSMKVIRDTVSKGTYLLSSSGPTYYNIGLVDGVRAARDFGEGRPVQKFGWFYPANYISNNFELVKEVARDYAITRTNNRMYINDAFNMITVGKPISMNEARVICTLFGLSGNPVMMGDDIATMSDERLSMIKRVLPVYRDSMKPCNLFGSTYPDAPNIFRLDIEKNWGSYSIFAVFNFNSQPIHETLKTADLNDPEGEYYVFDFWNEHVVGMMKGEVTVHVPPHDVKVLRFSKTQKHPWVVGTDMHVTQGGVEISHLRWDDEELMLKGVCNRPEGEKGRIFIGIPEGYEPMDFRELYITREEKQDLNEDGDKLLIGMKILDFNVSTADFSIYFRKTQRKV